MRYLGIDYGSQKVGLALSDEAGTMGFPHAVIKNDRHLLPTILGLIQEREIGGVVIGAPLPEEKGKNPVFLEAQKIGEALYASGVHVSYESEAFTTQEARRDIEGNRTVHGNVDAAAAALILTSYLSRPHDNH